MADILQISRVTLQAPQGAGWESAAALLGETTTATTLVVMAIANGVLALAETADAGNAMARVSVVCPSQALPENAESGLHSGVIAVCPSTIESGTSAAIAQSGVWLVAPGSTTASEATDASIASARVALINCGIVYEDAAGSLTVVNNSGDPVLLGTVVTSVDAITSVMSGVMRCLSSQSSEEATTSAGHATYSMLSPSELAESWATGILGRVSVICPRTGHPALAETSVISVLGTYSALDMPALTVASMRPQVLIKSAAGVMGMVAAGVADRWFCVAEKIAAGEVADASLNSIHIAAMPGVGPFDILANATLTPVVGAWGLPAEFASSISSGGAITVSLGLYQYGVTPQVPAALKTETGASAQTRYVVPGDRTRSQETVSFGGPIARMFTYAKSVLLGTSFASTLAIVYGVELVSFAGVELTDLFSYYSVAVEPPSSGEMISTTMIITGLVTVPVQ